MPSLSEAEEAYTALPGGTADISHLQAERQRSRMRLSSVARLEQVTSQRPASLVCIDISPYSRCKKIVADQLLYPCKNKCSLLSRESYLWPDRSALCSSACIKQDVFPKYSIFSCPAPV